MTPPASPVPALARWLAHGLTSRTHPVLAWALEHFLHPLGIEADCLEAEPFSALECGEGECWLRAPRWNPARFDPAHPARSDFGFALANPSSISIRVDSRGGMTLTSGEMPWNAARHGVRAMAEAEAFILACAGLLLARDPASALYSAGDDRGYCETVRQRLAASRGV